MVEAESVRDFLLRCARAMQLCAEGDEIKRGTDLFADQIAQASAKPFEPNPMPALDNLKWVKDMALARQFQEMATFLPWFESPRTLDHGQHSCVLYLNHLFDLQGLHAGLVYVDSHQTYPEHNHPGQEMYFLINGTAHWRFGGNETYIEMAPGNIIYNHPYNWHGVRAQASPMLGLYLLW